MNNLINNLANNLALSLFILGVVSIILGRILTEKKVPTKTQRIVFIIVASIYVLLLYKSKM
jgi:uncharacterized membrane protein YfcA